MLDAYSIRKAIPRVLIAVIGINLSIYLCIALVDITMIIGRGMNSLLVGPFVDTDSFSSLGVTGSFTGSVVGVLAGGGLLAGAFLAVLASAGAVASAAIALIGLLLPLIILVALVALAVLFTLVIRQGLLVFLTIISPVAIVCYILPGTEKYFKQWFDLFVKTLLVYPIIAAIFAMSNVLGAILLSSSSGSIGSALTTPASIFNHTFTFAQSGALQTSQAIAAILVLYAPLALIPFAFKFAGGAMAAVMNIANGQARRFSDRAGKSIQRSRQDPYSFFGSRKDAISRNRLQRRADFAESLKSRGSNGNISASRRRMYQSAAGIVGGRNIEARASAKRAEVGKLLNDQIATGRDEEIRGLTVDISQGYDNLARQNLARTQDGVRQYKSLGGQWIKEADVIAGHNRWGRDSFAQQAALSYEMRKASSDEQVEGITQRYESLATNSWGMSANTAAGAFIGAGFENQNTHLEFKHTDPMGKKLKYDAFVQEAYEKKGSYPLANMSAHTAKQLMRAYNDPGASDERKDQIRAISETFMQRGMGGAVAGLEGERPITTPATPGGPRPASETGESSPGYFGSQGAAHTNEAFRELARLTQVDRNGGPNEAYGNPASHDNSTPGAPQK